MRADGFAGDCEPGYGGTPDRVPLEQPNEWVPYEQPSHWPAEFFPRDGGAVDGAARDCFTHDSVPTNRDPDDPRAAAVHRGFGPVFQLAFEGLYGVFKADKHSPGLELHRPIRV